jgi:RNA polymerase sigma factor (sigma-70 family)
VKLARAVVRGDSKGRENLAPAVDEVVDAVVGRMMRNDPADDVEEVRQVIWSEVMKSIDVLAGGPKYGAENWLAGLATNQVRLYFRKKRRLRKKREELIDRQAGNAMIEDRSEFEEWDTVEAFVSSLEEEEQRVLMWRLERIEAVRDSGTYAEAADELGMNKWKVRRIVGKIRRKYSKFERKQK